MSFRLAIDDETEVTDAHNEVLALKTENVGGLSAGVVAVALLRHILVLSPSPLIVPELGPNYRCETGIGRVILPTEIAFALDGLYTPR